MIVARLILLIFFSLLSKFSYSLEIGIGTHFQSYPKESDYYLKLIKDYGFTSFRDDFTWAKIENEKGKYAIHENISKTNYAFLNSEEKYHLNGVLILNYGNKFYDGGAYPSSQSSINAFVNYATWTASHFKGKVKYYEIWNEWTLGSGMVRFRNEIPPANIYFELVKKTSEAIKKIDPNAVILAGSFNPLEQRARYIKTTDAQWFKELVDLGIMKYIDGVSLHTYSFLNGNRNLRTAQGNLEKIDSFHDYFSKLIGSDINIYITEMGVTNYSGPGGLSEDEAAQFIHDYTNGVRKRSYIKGIWWYDLINDGNDKSQREHNFGFFTSEDKPKKAAEIFLKITK